MKLKFNLLILTILYISFSYSICEKKLTDKINIVNKIGYDLALIKVYLLEGKIPLIWKAIAIPKDKTIKNITVPCLFGYIAFYKNISKEKIAEINNRWKSPKPMTLFEINERDKVISYDRSCLIKIKNNTLEIT